MGTVLRERDFYKVLELLCEWTLSPITTLGLAKYTTYAENKKCLKLISETEQTWANQMDVSYL